MMNEYPVTPVVLPIKEKRAFSVAEKYLLILALAVAVLFDRVLVVNFFTMNSPKFYGAFWICFLAAFYGFFWKILRHNIISWYMAGCAVLLCAWSFFFWDIAVFGDFGFINYLVIPAVMMGIIVYTTGDFHLKETGRIALAWLGGFFVKPFSGIPVFFEAVGASLFGEGKTNTKKAVPGAAIAFALLLILLPLLGSADKAFGYHLMQLLSNWDFGSIAGHSFVIIIACILFYSFMWNFGFNVKPKEHKKIASKIDTMVTCIILGSVILLYMIFCAVQFTYLFAGAGLPGGISYSEYAREGFAQTVVVCAINLLIFGVFLHYGVKNKVTVCLLTGLLVLTGVMLFSGFIRLGLYIDFYGMTWLRLLSAWFIIYLAIAVVLCGVRIWRDKLPLLAVCALILIGWYIVLGYINPDGFVAWYNELLDYDAVLLY